MEQVVKRIIWIDEKINDEQNQKYLKMLKEGIKDAQFYPVDSIEKAFYLIKNKKETVIMNDGTIRESKIFQFRLFYVIISGSLSNDYFNEYVKATKELTILAANIILTSDESKYKRNPYFLDKFLNPGEVTNHLDIYKIIEYINKDESPISNDSSLLQEKIIYIPKEEKYGNVFFYANNITDIAFPYYFGQLINSTFINDFDLETFQYFLLDYYPELKDFIFPSREKNIEIPYYLLAKFYLHMYTYEKCNFFKNMNFDLSNNKFDIYRVFIFLLYGALNQKSIKSFYNKELWRGTLLSKEELKSMEKAFINKEHLSLLSENIINNNEINACLYFSKTFLSFTKNINIAKGFMAKGNENLIPVLFEIDKIDDKKGPINDFLVTNLDLDNITEFNEEEVLFLPFSCFEIVSIKDEEINIFGEIIKIKKIKLNYLYKYKESINKYIDKIKDKEKMELFLKDVINSAFSNEISEIINFENLDIGEKFQKFFIEKINLKKDFLKLNPLVPLLKTKAVNYSQSIFNNFFDEPPEFIQNIIIEGKEALLLTYKSGKEMIMKSENNKICCSVNNKKCKNYKCQGKKVHLRNVKNEHVVRKLDKSQKEYNQGKNRNVNENCIGKLCHKDQKLQIENSYYFELYTAGLSIGDFIANYDQIKNEPLMVQLQSFGELGFSIIAPFIQTLFSSYLPDAVANYTPYVMSCISATKFILSIKDLRKENKLSNSETFTLVLQKAGLIIGQATLNYIIGALGFKILVFLQVSKGIVISTAALGFGIATGFGSAKYKDKLIKNIENSENLILYSDSLYYQYIPTKFRNYCVPTLSWKGVSKNAKSFALELVEDGIRKWLLINIKKWIKEINNENYYDNDIGQNIVEYQGISKNPYKVTFILYELNKEKCTPEEWGVGEKVEKGYSENLSKYFNQVAILDVY